MGKSYSKAKEKRHSKQYAHNQWEEKQSENH